MPSKYIILCRPLLLLPSIFPCIRVFSNHSVLRITWPKHWSFSVSISSSNEYSGWISFSMNWFDILAVQGTLKSLLQHHSSKASLLQHSVFFIVQLSHSYMTTGKNIALTRWTFVGKVMSLLFNMLSRLDRMWSDSMWSYRMWSTVEGNGKPLQYSCIENSMNSMKRQKDKILKDELPRSVCAQYATGDQWRNNSWRNEGTEPKKKQHPVVDVTGDRSKVRCCKEQYCIGTWNVRSMNQGKLEVVKQEMVRVNVDILGISRLR